MAEQPRNCSIQKLTLPIEVVAALELLPLNRSAAIGQAIIGGSHRPDLLPLALRIRMSKARSGNNVRISYSRELRMDDMIARLAQMTDLSGEQVIRLCIEAFIHKP